MTNCVRQPKLLPLSHMFGQMLAMFLPPIVPATTVLEKGAADSGAAEEVVRFPRWNRTRVATIVRNISQAVWILPLAMVFVHLRVEGRERLRGLDGPVVFAANHQSHLDTPALLLALPGRWGRRAAVSMAKEFFDAHFFAAQHSLWEVLSNSALYMLAALFFNGFPLRRTGPGTRETLRYIGELANAGFSIVIFPEGHRTERGEIGTFQPGVGIIGSRLRLPVVPVRLEGLDKVLHHTWRWPRPGNVRVAFGVPLTLDGSDYAALARRVQEAVLTL